MPVNVFPIPQSGQSVSCYLRALAERNGFSSVAQLKGRFCDNRNLIDHELCADDMAKVIGNRRAHIERLMLLSTARKSYEHSFGKLVIPSHHLRRCEMYCPACYREKGYMLAQWNIGWLPMCLKHERPLIEVDYEAERLMPTNTVPSKSVKDRRHYDLFGYANVCETQERLEHLLLQASNGRTRADSLIGLIDEKIIAGSRLASIEQVKLRRRRYLLRYYPFKDMDSINFLSCFSKELRVA